MTPELIIRTFFFGALIGAGIFLAFIIAPLIRTTMNPSEEDDSNKPS